MIINTCKCQPARLSVHTFSFPFKECVLSPFGSCTFPSTKWHFLSFFRVKGPCYIFDFMYKVKNPSFLTPAFGICAITCRTWGIHEHFMLQHMNNFYFGDMWMNCSVVALKMQRAQAHPSPAPPGPITDKYDACFELVFGVPHWANQSHFRCWNSAEMRCINSLNLSNTELWDTARKCASYQIIFFISTCQFFQRRL